jgi:hypothetical protein
MFRYLLLVPLLGGLPAADPPKWWDAADVGIWYAQHGYEPDHPKVVTTALTAERFIIERSADGQEMFAGELRPIDRGWRQGNFTAFRTPGTYRIRIGDQTGPGTFTIAPHRWDDLLQASAWHYFGVRRMGEDSVVGNLGDERLVNWEHASVLDADGTSRYKYIGRAWGDGDDGRTYASCSLVVAQYCALQDTNPTWDRCHWIYQQVRWGLNGALSFLEKDGTLRWILSSQDHQQHSYDNRFYSGDEKRLVDWNDVKGATEEYNDTNPEVIAASLLIGPAYATALFRERDPEFFARVEALVRLGHRRMSERFGAFPTKYSLGAWIWLNVAMHRMIGEARFLDLAAEGADRLLSLQQQEFVGDDSVQAKGWFRRDAQTSANPQGEKPEQEVMITPWIYQGLFQLIAAHPTHPRNAAWRAAVGSYARDYLLALGRLDPFGFTPMKVMVLEPEKRIPCANGAATWPGRISPAAWVASSIRSAMPPSWFNPVACLRMTNWSQPAGGSSSGSLVTTPRGWPPSMVSAPMSTRASISRTRWGVVSPVARSTAPSATPRTSPGSGVSTSTTPTATSTCCGSPPWPVARNSAIPWPCGPVRSRNRPIPRIPSTIPEPRFRCDSRADRSSVLQAWCQSIPISPSSGAWTECQAATRRSAPSPPMAPTPRHRSPPRARSALRPSPPRIPPGGPPRR